MTEIAQQRTLTELRQELLWLRDLVEMALRRFGFEDAEAQPLPAPAPMLPVAAPAQVPPPETDGKEQLVRIEVVAQRLGLTTKNIRKRVADKTIPHRRLGHTSHARVRFYLSEVDAWLDGAALQAIENGISLTNLQTLAASWHEEPPVAARQGQKLKRSPHLKRRLSYTA